MDVATDPHQRLIDDLLGFGDLKVWSVLVTIFGDLAPASGAYVPGPFLTALTTELGIKPEAQRVALHRLRKDGWIEAKKDGRVSLYALSALARRETRSVQSRIFDARVARPGKVHLIVVEPGRERDAPGDWLPVAAGVYLSDSAPEGARALLVSSVDVTALPDWVRRAAMAEETQANYRALTDLLSQDIGLPAGPPEKALALRLLILHRWRRLVLSHSRPAAHVMGPGWIGNACRGEVQRWLSDLPRPARAEIEAH